MIKKLKGMKLKQRLNFGYKVVIALMVISGIMSGLAIATLNNSLDSFVNGSNAADSAVKICRIDVNIAARNVREMALNSDTSSYAGYKQAVDEKVADIEAELAVLKGTGLIEDSLYQRYETALNEWETIGYAIMGKIEAGDAEGARLQILSECTPALDEVIAIGMEIDEVTDDLMDESVSFSNIVFLVGIISISIFVIAAILISVKLGKVIVSSITEPLAEVEKVAVELSEGNLHSNLEYRSDDEIGHLAHSLRKSIRVLGGYVDDIADFMKNFSEGNFAVDALVEWKGDFIAILDSIKEFEKSMATTVTGIQAVAQQVKGGSDQVAASANELAEGATEQASITEELAATIESVASQVERNAEEAKHVSGQVQQAGAAIVDSNDMMQEMVASMTEINDASQEISKIIATINDIASQTNLLALNASIEAARAGEAGKGFAVVADQVSILAAQSAEAAKESTVLIDASVRAVEKGMVIANDTAKQLEGVKENALLVAGEVDAIATALEAQHEAFSQINAGVDQINDVVQTNSATSEECAAASQEMNSQATSLEDVIGQFKVLEN